MKTEVPRGSLIRRSESELKPLSFDYQFAFFFFLILVEPSGSVDLLKTLGLCLFGKPFYSTVYGYWPEVF